ncbi:MAG: hypothetical protein HYR85_09675 [Planctomycetes bacterium]|nr:hypothetical protein [Planctomycetota bacterium]MBI3847970.1 hypothetical protein [Planctomycetota bacterium]
MKSARRLVTVLVFAAMTGCVSQRNGTLVGIEADASIPTAAEVRAKEDVEARERRRAFVDGELRWILENAKPHADATTAAGPR